MPSFEETLYGEITSFSETEPKSISQKSNTQPKAKLSSIIGRSTRASYWVESLSLKEVDKNVLDSDIAWLNDKYIMAAQTSYWVSYIALEIFVHDLYVIQ